MNILFTDTTGILFGFHFDKEQSKKPEPLLFDERKIPILKSICDETKAKVVLSSGLRMQWGPKKEPEGKALRDLLSSFQKYGVPFYGRTPIIEKRINEYSYYPTWKEYEIQAYLECHPEVDHICILDNGASHLEAFQDFVVTPDYYTESGENEGLMPFHKDEIARVLKKNYWQ